MLGVGDLGKRDLVLLPMIRSWLRADTRRLGRWGEKQCRRFLGRKGLKVVARNYTCPLGEIDLVVAEPDGAIVFVEVKTRRNEEYQQAQDAVNYKKRRKLGRLAALQGSQGLDELRAICSNNQLHQDIVEKINLICHH